MKLIIALVFSVAALCNGAALTHDYLLQNSLADSLGGPSLLSFGGNLSASGYAFTANHGLSVSGALANGADYSIALDFNFTNLNSYRKVLDLHNRTSDSGLYTLDTRPIYYTGQTGLAGAVSSGVNATMVLTRSAGTQVVAAYVNGVQQFSGGDGLDPAIFNGPNNIIYFFMDDTVITGNDPTGTVKRIRIFDGALSATEVSNLDSIATSTPEPGTAWVVGALCVTLGYRRRRPS